MIPWSHRAEGSDATEEATDDERDLAIEPIPVDRLANKCGVRLRQSYLRAPGGQFVLYQWFFGNYAAGCGVPKNRMAVWLRVASRSGFAN